MAEAMVIFTRTYDFVSWLLPLTLNFPRSQRFVVTARLQGAALNFQERLIEANAARGRSRAEHLRVADSELYKVRLYLRLCERWRWLTPGQYHHAAEQVAELGRLLGGWVKVSGQRDSPSPGEAHKRNDAAGEGGVASLTGMA